MKAMIKMIYLHFKYADLQGEKLLYNGITVDNVNEFSFAELNHIIEVDKEILQIKNQLEK